MDKLIILDTNIIMRYPLLMALMKERHRLEVPHGVLSEIGRFGDSGISKLLHSGKIRVLKRQDSLEHIQRRYPKLGAVDAEILFDAMLVGKAGHREPVIATDDADLARAAEENGIEVMRSSDIAALIRAAPDRETEVEEFIQDERRRSLLLSAVGFCLGALTALAVVNYETICRTFPVWIWFLLPFPPAVGLLWLKAHCLRFYASIEVGVGVALAYMACHPDGRIMIDSNSALKGLAAVYVIVRGLGHLGETFHGSLRVRWNQWFEAKAA